MKYFLVSIFSIISVIVLLYVLKDKKDSQPKEDLKNKILTLVKTKEFKKLTKQKEFKDLILTQEFIDLGFLFGRDFVLDQLGFYEEINWNY